MTLSPFPFLPPLDCFLDVKCNDDPLSCPLILFPILSRDAGVGLLILILHNVKILLGDSESHQLMLKLIILPYKRGDYGQEVRLVCFPPYPS